MRRFFLLPLIAWASLAADGLSQVQSVYVLPMGSGLDQYLAQRLTREAVFTVVADPKLADAVFTDQIGMAFERKLMELYPPELAAPKSEAGGKPKKDDPAEEERKLSEMLKREGDFRPSSTFHRGKGNLFLVDVKTKRVLWSVYEPAKNYRSAELEKTCGRISAQLQKDLGRGKGTK